jgi:hypothetical protein
MKNLEKLTELEKPNSKIHQQRGNQDAGPLPNYLCERRRSCCYSRTALLETFAKRLEIKGIKFAEVTLHVV